MFQCSSDRYIEVIGIPSVQEKQIRQREGMPLSVHEAEGSIWTRLLGIGDENFCPGHIGLSIEKMFS